MALLKQRSQTTPGFNNTIRCYIGAVAKTREPIIQRIFQQIYSPADRAAGQIPVNATLLIIYMLICGRTTFNKQLSSDIALNFKDVELPQELCNHFVQMPVQGKIFSNEINTYIRLTNADEQHLANCLVNGAFKRALFDIQQYFRAAAIKLNRINYETLENIKPVTLNKFSISAVIADPVKIDRSDLRCAEAEDITEIEANLAIAEIQDPDNPEATIRQINCIDNTSNLIGRWTPVVNAANTYVVPNGYNAYNNTQWVSVLSASPNINTESVSDLYVQMFGLYINADQISTASSCYCLKNLFLEATVFETSQIVDGFTSDLFGRPTPLKDAPNEGAEIFKPKFKTIETRIASDSVSTHEAVSSIPVSRVNTTSGGGRFNRKVELLPKPGLGRPSTRLQSVKGEGFTNQPLARTTPDRTKIINVIIDCLFKLGLFE